MNSDSFQGSSWSLPTCCPDRHDQATRNTQARQKTSKSTQSLLYWIWYDFNHVTSSPGFPRSNGLAEKGVQIVKRIVKKTSETRDDLWLGLLAYRTAPLEDGRSPGELLQGRRLRTPLPDFTQEPCSPVFKRNPPDARRRTLPPLRKGDVVRIKGKQWIRRAQVVGKLAPRSYQVVTEDNQLLRRNRQHLLRTREPFLLGTTESSDSDNEDAAERNELSPPCSAGPACTLPAGTVGTSSTTTAAPAPRRSARPTRQPRRLYYDANFQQVC
ncbi:uncharacterized protein LOC119394817 [Rhipicephalus sanguineus]|uniref:uncharacterized protein LOC119394817 n=1 Tax=Rhipicephalus sanguineus TaxID=34632 RepID=UPI001895F72D|nr:uncharacterized protein LOC119394817 [Rhipicephalus sanguineus]